MIRKRRITSELLRKLAACESQVELFKKVFPRGAAFTRANAIKAFRKGLDVKWITSRLLPNKEKVDYNYGLCEIIWTGSYLTKEKRERKFTYKTLFGK